MPNVQHFASREASFTPEPSTFRNATAATFSPPKRRTPRMKIAALNVPETVLRLVVEETD